MATKRPASVSPRYPWGRLSPEIADDLRPTLPEITADMVSAIAREVPAYSGPVRRQIEPTVRRGVEIALSRYLDLFGTDQPALAGRARSFYARIGATENDQGRTLDSLLSAYRTGARVAWEHMSAAAVAQGVATDDLVVLAESIFVYIDELSGASAQGHARAQADSSGYRDALRGRLAQAILDGDSVSAPDRVAGLAEATGWPVPDLLTVAVVPRSRDTTGPSLPTAPRDVLVIEREHDALAVIPDPVGPGRREQLTQGLRGPVFVGTVQPPERAAVSRDHAVRLRDLSIAGEVPGDQVVLALDHLPLLQLTADAELAELSRARALRPLLAVPESKRHVMAETLAAWLDHQGDRGAVARELVIHPQTVSYRMHRLRELFGDTLDDPEGRFALQVALRSGRRIPV